MLNRIRTIPDKIRHLWRAARLHRQRIAAESSLKIIPPAGPPLVHGPVLVDAAWDNPNYWVRYQILRAALGLAAVEEVGLLGRFRRREQLGTLKRLGIRRHFDLMDFADIPPAIREEARRRCDPARTQADALAWRLPLDFPADFLYDQVLKVQRRASIDFDDPAFLENTALCLHYLALYDRLLARERPGLVISAHNIGLYATLVWAALKRGIPVIVPFGDLGVMRFWHLTDAAQMYDFMDRPRPGDLAALTPAQTDALEQMGRIALSLRLGGMTTNLGASFAYAPDKDAVDRSDICRQLGFDPARPLVGVYAANWFDYPHALGMSLFENFYDWLNATLEAAAVQQDVQWLFKAHPVDAWYGGLTLGDLIDVARFPHIRLAPGHWHGAAMLKALDAFITYHGTVGIEAAALGKPVLVADKGWYDDWGFVKSPRSRQEYLDWLATAWWEDMDQAKNARLACIFAGCYWGKPVWQDGFLLEDDSRQWAIYPLIPPLIRQRRHILEQETALLREWFLSGQPHYHTYKMSRAGQYSP
jgi:hypothetical protein